LERFQAIDERGPWHGVAADSDAGRLADAFLGQLIQRLIRERARTRDDADWPPGRGDLARGDADIALARCDDARAVRTEQAHAWKIAPEAVVEARLVLGWHTLGDHRAEANARLGGLHHGTLDARRWHEDARSRRAGRGDGFLHGGEDGNALDVGARAP